MKTKNVSRVKETHATHRHFPCCKLTWSPTALLCTGITPPICWKNTSQNITIELQGWGSEDCLNDSKYRKPSIGLFFCLFWQFPLHLKCWHSVYRWVSNKNKRLASPAAQLWHALSSRSWVLSKPVKALQGHSFYLLSLSTCITSPYPSNTIITSIKMSLCCSHSQMYIIMLVKILKIIYMFTYFHGK